MSSIIECSKAGSTLRNTGTNEECLVGPVVRYALAKPEQEFSTKESAKTLADWNAAVALKSIIPLFAIEVLANANIDAKTYEARRKFVTKAEVKVVTSENHLGVCSYGALASYNGKKMRIYEFTDDQKIVGVTNEEGIIVKGQLVTIEVGMLIPSLDDKPQYCVVTVTYEDWKEFVNNPVVLSPSWSQIDLKGIFDAYIKVISASATSVKFTVDGGCSGDKIVSLDTLDLTFKKANGTPITHSLVLADPNGVYEFMGTGFATGDLIGLNGVVVQPEATYEAVKKVAIVVTP